MNLSVPLNSVIAFARSCEMWNGRPLCPGRVHCRRSLGQCLLMTSAGGRSSSVATKMKSRVLFYSGATGDGTQNIHQPFGLGTRQAEQHARSGSCRAGPGRLRVPALGSQILSVASWCLSSPASCRKVPRAPAEPTLSPGSLGVHARGH